MTTSGAGVCVASRGTVERGQDWPCAVFGESELKMRRHSPHGVHIACHFPPSLSLLYSLSTRRSMCISSCVIHTSPYSGSTLCHVIDRSGSRFRICRVSCFPVIHRSALLEVDLGLVVHVDLLCWRVWIWRRMWIWHVSSEYFLGSLQLTPMFPCQPSGTHSCV